MPDNLIQVMFGILERKAQAGLGSVDMYCCELDDMLMVELPQQHDFTHSSGRNAITLLCGQAVQ